MDGKLSYKKSSNLPWWHNRDKSYDRDFKQKAVELSLARGNAREIAEELGIRPELLHRWRRELEQYQSNSFPGKGKPKMTDLEQEVARRYCRRYY